MQKKVIVALANGFEEIEVITPIDVWRRAGFEVVSASIGDSLLVTGAHGIEIAADQLFENTNFDDADIIFLPGGMPGASNLDQHEGLRKKLSTFNTQGKTIAAICAAPIVLGHNNMLQGRKATCYPGFEEELSGAEYTANDVETDGHIITSKGPGVAMEFALSVLAKFVGKNEALDLAKKMQVRNPVVYG